MTRNFDVAHVREQGVDLIIVPLSGQFGYLTAEQQQSEIANLQRCATIAGLRGKVVPVWPQSTGRMAFIAPQNCHPFFRSLTMERITLNVNKKLSCG